MLPSYFIFIGFLINIYGVSNYILDTLRGKVKPNRVSFFLWSIAPLVTFSAQLQKGVGFIALFSLFVAFTPLITLLATFFNRKSVWKLTTFDLCCGLLSILGLILWFITKEGNTAIILSILADALATLPTLKKAYLFPETESSFPWATGTVYAGISLLTIRHWNFPSAGFAVYYFIAMFLIYIFVQTKVGKFVK